MALTNSEKQARYRKRVKTERDKLRRIILRLRSDIVHLTRLLEAKK